MIASWLLGNDRTFAHQNVYKARGLRIENAASWLSPGRHVGVDGMLTWQDVRNASNEGTLGDFEGDRIPNRPYLFASWGAHLRFDALPGLEDTLEPFYSGRYVHGFYRGWESQGLRQFKQSVDDQVTHTAGVSWTLDHYPYRGSVTFEADTLTDAKVYDNFGVQRPGRAFYFNGLACAFCGGTHSGGGARRREHAPARRRAAARQLIRQPDRPSSGSRGRPARRAAR